MNPAEVALRKIAAEVDRFIVGLDTNTTAHAIVIPIRRRSSAVPRAAAASKTS